MGDVTGPISTLPGRTYDVPVGQECDSHPGRLATVRIQGETDSFGCEMHDLCEDCAAEMQREFLTPLEGECDWCRNTVSELHCQRDYEEGLCGRIYQVCSACRKRYYDELRAEITSCGDFD